MHKKLSGLKVVIFCGGFGMRLREYTDSIPKPLVPVGHLPILWHVMKYYAHFGHKDFILCVGYGAEAIRESFSRNGNRPKFPRTASVTDRNLELFERDLREWNITFVDSGLHSNIGQRLKATEKYLAGEEMFLANYADALSDLPLPKLLQFAKGHGKIATFVSAKPNLSYHVVSFRPDGVVSDIRAIRDTGLQVNSGFFVFKPDIFKYLRDGEELVCEPFERLIKEEQLMAYRHDGFYACMDTFKDKQQLDAMYARGDTPWLLWEKVARERELAFPGSSDRLVREVYHPGLNGSATDAYSAWLGRQVVLQIEAGESRVPLRGRVINESSDALRFRIDGCWEVDIFKKMIVQVEADNFEIPEPIRMGSSSSVLA
jgi:glucose-1-phosphate cytidylyltransferase